MTYTININNLPQEKFGDSPELADELADLIVRGIKTATCSAYSSKKDRINIGHKVVVLNSKNKSVCIIETVKIDIIEFNKISEAFAHKEGEGDLSLEFWRKEHKKFFEKMGFFSENMLLFCEEIKVVHIF